MLSLPRALFLPGHGYLEFVSLIRSSPCFQRRKGHTHAIQLFVENAIPWMIIFHVVAPRIMLDIVGLEPCALARVL